MKTFYLLFVSLFISLGTLQAGIIDVTPSILKTVPGTPLLVNTISLPVSVSAPIGSQVDLGNQGVVTVGIDHHYPAVVAPYQLKLGVEVKSYSATGTLISTNTHIFNVAYAPDDSTTFRDRMVIVVNSNAYSYTSKIVSIEKNGMAETVVPENVYIQSDLFINRLSDYTSSASNAPSVLPYVLLDTDSDGVMDEIEIKWLSQFGAEEYQLEWAFVNDYKDESTFYSIGELSQMKINFKLNSTRISTTKLSYRISLAFDHGYLVFRLRGLGRKPSELNRVFFSPWSVQDEVTITDVYGINNKSYHQTQSYEINKNWQYSSTYAEEGKKKEVVSFYDGTLRNRQMVTKINSDDNTIVGETIYDHQGRPVIQVLPTPVDDPTVTLPGNNQESSLKYYPGFTKDEFGQEFERTDFDKNTGNICTVEPEPMSNTSGASHYYSSQNLDNSGAQGYLPDAELYPYSQVEYTPDNTGRIRRQGGVGETFQLGSKHESKYFYAHPFQENLNNLFGSEVGNAAHYQKNMVVDPNGQVSVSYLDQEGRVIATSLAGIAPAQLKELNPNTEFDNITVDLFAKNAAGESVANELNEVEASVEFNQVVALSSPSQIKLDYGITIDPFESDCLSDVCLSCIYDLNIEIRDECGQLVPDTLTGLQNISTMVGRFQVNTNTNKIEFFIDAANCTYDNTLETSFETGVLKVGTYQITKKLTVNQEALAYYLNLYLNDQTLNNECIKTYDELLADLESTTPLEDCEINLDCDACVAALGTVEEYITSGKGTQEEYLEEVAICKAPCEQDSYYETMYEQLRVDFLSGNQYAEYLLADGTISPSSFNLSILNEDNRLPISENGGTADWKHPKFIRNGSVETVYYEEDLVTPSMVNVDVTLNGLGQIISSIPNCDNLNAIVLDAQTQLYYTIPENLADVQDFIEAYLDNPSWSHSFVAYHPEYGMLKTFGELYTKISATDARTSEQFDSLLFNINSWESAINNGFIPIDWNILPVSQRIVNFTSNTFANYDPFAVHAANFGTTTSNVYTNVFTNFQSISGVNYSMFEMAALTVRCGGSSIGYQPSATCVAFGEDISSDPIINTETRDKEWQAFKNLYYSFKQQLILKEAQRRSLEVPGYESYNKCIADDDFDPFDNNFINYINFPTSGGFFNPLQPCYIQTATLYFEKQRRFMNPLDQDNLDPNNTAYQLYLLTGQCPTASAFQSVLSELAATDNLVSTNFLMNDLGSYTGLILAEDDYAVQSPLPQRNWIVQTQTPNTLQATIEEGGVTQYSVVLSSNTAIDWADLVSFQNLQYNSAGGSSNFTVVAMMETGGVNVPVELTGLTSFPIGICRFDEVCEANAVGNSVERLMKSLALNGQLFTSTPIDVQNTAPYSSFVSNQLQIAANGSATVQLNYKYDAATKVFSLYETTLLERLKLSINSTSPSTFSFGTLSSIGSVEEVIVKQDNTFDIVLNDLSGNYLVTFNCDALYELGSSKKQIPFGDCALPTSALCTDPSIKTASNLFSVLKDVLVNQDQPFNLMNSLYVDEPLLSTFASLPNSVTSSQVIGSSTAIKFDIKSNCDLKLDIISTTNPSVGFNDIVSMQNPQLIGAEDNTGNYHQFQFEAYTATGEILTIQGTTCIDLQSCDQCLDDVPFSEYTENELDSISDAQIQAGIALKDNSVANYIAYKTALENLNGSQGWTGANYVQPVSYEVFFVNGITYPIDIYLQFIQDFDTTLDNSAYLTDPMLFFTEYGIQRNALKEYDRYTMAMVQYNADRSALGLSQLTPVSDSAFVETIYVDSLNAYIEYARSSITTQSGAQQINQYPSAAVAKIDPSICLDLYKQYAQAYKYFIVAQQANNTCLNYQTFTPMVSYQVFIDNNLCCSADGLSALQAYIASFSSTTTCPGQVPFKPSCAEPVQVDTSACMQNWLNYQSLIDQYNTSAHATYSNTQLLNLYPNFISFQQTGKCDCVLDYNRYISYYVTLDSIGASIVGGMVQTLDEYCPSQELTPESSNCEESYQQYLNCISLYNTWAAANSQKPITGIISFEKFVINDLCNCVDAYCSDLNQIMDGIKPADRLTDISTICTQTTKPPCTPDVALNNFVEAIEIDYIDPCVAMNEGNLAANATTEYEQLIQKLTTDFTTEYTKHCLGAVEEFTMNYVDREQHFTLYYYDQAGNLIKTVPPEGVEKLNVYTNTALNDAIEADRANGTHFVNTNHRMATTYLYNSLNQLVAQNMPDQDPANIFELTQANGLVVGLNTTAIQLLNENVGYLSGYVALSSSIYPTSFTTRGYLYKTENGGKNWIRIQNTLGANLNTISWSQTNAQIGFAIGEQGTLLRTQDGGISWDLYNSFGQGITGNYVGVEALNQGAGAGAGNNRVYAAQDNGQIYHWDLAMNALINDLSSTNVIDPVLGTPILTLVKLKEVSFNKTGTSFGSIEPYAIARLSDGTNEFDAIIKKSNFLLPWQVVSLTMPQVNTMAPIGLNHVISFGNNGNKVEFISSDPLSSSNPSVPEGSLLGTTGILDNVVQAYFVNQLNGIIKKQGATQNEVLYTTNGGETWTSFDDELIGYQLGLVEQTANYVEVLATSLARYKRLRIYDNGQLMVIDQSSSAPQNIDFVSSGAIKEGAGAAASTTYFGVNAIGQVYRSNTVSNGTTPLNFSPLVSLPGGLTAKEIMLSKNSTGAVTFTVLTTNGKIYGSSASTAGGAFSNLLFVSGQTSTNFVDLDKITIGTNNYYVALNTVNRRLYGVAATSTGLGSVLGFTLIGSSPTFDATTNLISTNGNKVFASGNSSKTWSMSLSFASSNLVSSNQARDLIGSRSNLNDISRSNANEFQIVGNRGRYIQVVGTIATITNTNTTADLFDAKRFGTGATVRTLIVGENGTLLEFNSSNVLSQPTSLSGLSIAESVNFQTLKGIDVTTISGAINVYAVGENGSVLYSPNYLTTPLAGLSNVANANLTGVKWIPGQASAHAIGNDGKLFRLVGMNLTQNHNVFVPRLSDVHFADAALGTTVGANFTLRTTKDGGQTWKVSLPDASGASLPVLAKVWTFKTQTADQVFALVGGTNYFRKVYQNQVQIANSISVTGTFADIQFSKTSPLSGYYLLSGANSLRKLNLIADPTDGYAVASQTLISTTIPSTAKALHIFENQNVMVLSLNGRLTQYNNATNSMALVLNGAGSLPAGLSMNDIYFHDDRSGYMVGNNAAFFRLNSVGLPVANNVINSVNYTQLVPTPDIVNAGGTINDNIVAIAFGSRYDGVYGGSYSTPALLSANVGMVRTIHDEGNAFTARFFYDRLGRIVVSQNSRQYDEKKFSYSLYDELGRVYEAGEKEDNVMAGNKKFKEIFGTYVGGTYVPSVVDDDNLKKWLNGFNSTNTNNELAKRREVTRSYYDETETALLSSELSAAGFNPNSLTQRKRIVHVAYYTQLVSIPASPQVIDESKFDHATHYDYDIHGNVQTLWQDNRKMAIEATDIASQRVKRMDYRYDLISGNVHRVDYETGKRDQWHHAYEYDSDNRITDVYTSTATPMATNQNVVSDVQNEPVISPYWDKEASYSYYAHGPLARTELGAEKVQGLDYVYTLQGWIKGVNSGNLDPMNDPGKDGASGSTNEFVARDVMGFALQYYAGDFVSATAANNGFLTEQVGSDLDANSFDLFNGNIGTMVTTITNPDTREILPLGNAYQYDQLNRLADARSFTNLAGNTWGQNGSVKYENNFTYDANGNILSQKRKNENGAIIDDLSYQYENQDGSVSMNGVKKRNRLMYVKDNESSTSFTDDIDNQLAGNYVYDKEGRLKSDEAEKISITWRVDGKVKTVKQTDSKAGEFSLSFDYDAMGHRIAKHSYDKVGSANGGLGNLVKSTYYILDAQGNTMAVYERAVNATNESITFEHTEKHLFGSSRLGVMNVQVNLLGSAGTAPYTQTNWTHKIGQRNYELSNHLGNVLAVISDKPVPHTTNGTTHDYYMADIRQSTDYSGFGVQLSGRNFLKTGISKDYRRGFQGQEEDDELKGEGNSVNYTYRMHDPRLGRFFAVDPLAKDYHWYSPYTFSGNEVIAKIELEGLEPADYLLTTKNIGRSLIAVSQAKGQEGQKYYWRLVSNPSKTSMTWEQGKRFIAPKPKPKPDPINAELEPYTAVQDNNTASNYTPNLNFAPIIKKEVSGIDKMINEAWNKGDYPRAFRYMGNKMNHAYEGEKGLVKYAGNLGSIGTALQYTPFASVGVGLSGASLAINTSLDFKNENPNAWSNLGINIAGNVVGSKLGIGKYVDKLPIKDYQKQIVDGAINESIETVSDKYIKQ